MDIPAPEMRLEVQPLVLQASLVILGVAALVLGAQEPRVLRIAGAGAWSLVALGGLLSGTSGLATSRDRTCHPIPSTPAYSRLDRTTPTMS